jgi:DNA-binding transcriptional ArsR family regulator
MIDGAKPVNQLVELIGQSQPVVSKHLRILRESGLVSVERNGQQRLYSINPQPLRELDQWLQPYRQFWADRLDALEAHLNNLPEEEDR